MIPLQIPANPLLLGPLCPGLPQSWLGELGCAFAAREPITLAVAGLLVIGGVGFTLYQKRRRREELRGPTFLVFPLDSKGRAASRAAERSAPPSGAKSSQEDRTRTRKATKDSTTIEGPAEPQATPDPRYPWQDPEPPAPPRSSSQLATPGPRPDRAAAPDPEPPADPSQRMAVPVGSADSPPSTPATPPSTWIDAGPVRFEEPPEGTLQLLPGRLELQSGEGQGREIRFVRVPGTDPEVTLGRSEGPAYRHIQLRSPTVSRLHARMHFHDGTWSIVNESTTNPTILNGTAMDASDGATLLRDGDRIEMGEVVFLFRQPEVGDRLPFRSSWYTDRGRRSTNQDAVAVRTLTDGRELALVCDGMGAHSAGELASHEALETVVQTLENGRSLRDAVQEANRRVRSRAEGSSETEGMGTTLVALLRRGEGYEIANVGDSRAYRLDAEGLRQITDDHSFVAEVVRDGRMSAEEAARSPWKNAVTRHLGAEADIEIDLFDGFSTQEPHLVILCSDGLHSALSDDRIREIAIMTPQVQDLARELGEAALRGGSDDNVSVAVLAFGGGVPRG
jgi:PPM family protein phosphatase